MIASLRFASAISPTWIIVAAATLAIAAGLFYLRETRHLRSPLAYVLPSLRAAAIGIAVLTLAVPVWHTETIVGSLGRVILAVDRSASMSATDSASPGGRSRIDRVIADLNERTFAPESGFQTAAEGLIERLADAHDVEVVTFASDDPVALDDPTAIASIVADGATTDLASAMAVVGPDSATTAVVIFSDGRDNVGRPKSAEAAATVHTIGYGSPEETPDVGIDSITHADTVAIDGTLAGTINVKRAAIEGDVDVLLSAAGREVWRTTIDSSDSGAVPFEISVADILDILASPTPPDSSVTRETEVLDLVASVQPAAATMVDSIPQNNSRTLRVAATTRLRQLLILDGSVRWETRYLRNLFDRDPTWQVRSVIFGAGTDIASVDRGDGVRQLPATARDWNAYDAIILGEVPPDQIQPADVDAIVTFVRRGGGLIVIDGGYGRLETLANIRGTDPESTSLLDLFPVTPGEIIDTPVQSFELSPSVATGPMFNLAGRSDQIAALWKSLPPPQTIAAGEIRPGAETWISARIDDQTRLPYMSTRLYGGGRVFYFAAGESWRWRYKVADQFHGRFWNAVLAAAMQPPYAAADRFVAVATDAIQYKPGDAPEIRVRLRGGDGEPVGDSTVDAIITSPDGAVTIVPMAADDPDRGTYRATAASLGDGEYSITVRASGFDNRQLHASAPIWVDPDTAAEWSRLSLDADTLRSIASQNNGSYLPESEVERLPDLLAPLSSGRRVVTDVELWQSWWWFAVILTLLSIEWLLRKVAGLT